MTKTDRERQRKAPILRFKGFTDDWEQRKLKNLITEPLSYGLSVSSKEYDGIHKYLRITDIDEKSRKFNKDKLTSPDIKFNSSSKKYLLSNNDIVFARTGASTGKTYMYQKEDGIVYYAGFLIKASLSSNFDNNFIFQQTYRKRYYQRVKVISQRSGQPGINSKEYGNFDFLITQIEEQNKIGKLFKIFDNLLALYERKYQLYLPQFQKLQRVIFDNSDDFISLSSLIEIKTGNRNSQDNVKNGKYVFFDRSTEIKKLNEFDFDEEAIIIPGEGTKFAPKYVNGKYALHQRSYSLYNFSQEIDSKYLYYFLMTQSNTLLRYSVGTTVPSLRVSTFDHIKVPMYSKELQMKYASTFDSLEKLLSQIKKKTNILRSLKQFLLQVLFL